MRAEIENSENQLEVEPLKSLREAAGLTQPELSQRIKVGIRIIGHWEKRTKIPRFDNAIALSRELRVSLKTLARSIGLDSSAVPDDTPTLTLEELKTICRELGIDRVEDLPSDWSELMELRLSRQPQDPSQ